MESVRFTEDLIPTIPTSVILSQNESSIAGEIE